MKFHSGNSQLLERKVASSARQRNTICLLCFAARVVSFVPAIVRNPDHLLFLNVGFTAANSMRKPISS